MRKSNFNLASFFSRSLAIAAAVMGIAFTASPVQASVPSTRVTDDTALYQNLSEIRVPRTKSINVDLELKQVVAAENRYRERLPRLADRDDLQGPMKRVRRMKYHPLAPRQEAGRADSGGFSGQ